MTNAPIPEGRKVHLEAEDLALRSKELAERIQLIASLEEERKQAVAGFKAKIKRHQKRVNELLDIVLSGEETLPLASQAELPFNDEEELGKEQEVLFDLAAKDSKTAQPFIHSGVMEMPDEAPRTAQSGD